jgi:hypothetical protein
MGRRSPRAHARHPWTRMREFETFLSPEAVFSSPFDVVGHPDLNIGEKRAILARWLARICATEAALGLKWIPATDAEGVQFDDVMDALHALEREAARPGPQGATGLAVPAGKLPKAAGTVH